MPAERLRMSAVDSAWLRMDRPHNPMTVLGVLVFDRAPGFRRVRQRVASRWLRFERFRCRPAPDVLGAAWEPDRRFDLDAHLRRVALPAPAGRRELEVMLSDLAGSPLDGRRPLWQFHYVDNYAGTAALIVRIHHCYADGIALAHAFRSLVDGAPAVARPHAAPRQPDRPLASAAAWLGSLAVAPFDHAPVGELAGRTFGIAVELGRLATLPDDPPSLKRPLGRRKAVAWAEPLALHEVRTVARALGCTVNDVLLAAAAGALGRYLRRPDGPGAPGQLRAAVPVNLRDPAEAGELGNSFGLVFVDLPIGVRAPLARVRAVHETMSGLKASLQPAATLSLLTVLGRLGGAAQDATVELLSRKASLVVTNVPGPAEPLRIAGRQVSRAIFWVPQSGSIGLGLSILSHAGRVEFGVLADRGLVDDPGALAAGFCEEFEAILLATLLGPYLEKRD